MPGILTSLPGSAPRRAMRFTCTITMPPARRVACAIASISPNTASSSIVTLPSSSAVVPRRNATLTGTGLKKSHSSPTRFTTSTKSGGVRGLCRAPCCRGSTKVCNPVLVSKPGRPAAMSRMSWESTPCGSVYASILSAAARRTNPGESTNALVTARLSRPSCARCDAPRSARSPTPTTLTDVRPSGLPSARKRRSTAASNASGTAWPPPDPLINIASPSSRRCAASSAVIFSIGCVLLDIQCISSACHVREG